MRCRSEEAANIKQVPGSLGQVLDALEADHEFLLPEDVFTEDVIETWIRFKRVREIDPLRLRPHLEEYYLHSMHNSWVLQLELVELGVMSHSLSCLPR